MHFAFCFQARAKTLDCQICEYNCLWPMLSTHSSAAQPKFIQTNSSAMCKSCLFFLLCVHFVCRGFRPSSSSFLARPLPKSQNISNSAVCSAVRKNLSTLPLSVCEDLDTLNPRRGTCEKGGAGPKGWFGIVPKNTCWSLLSGFLEVVKLLVSQTADVMCKDKQGYTPLHAAAVNGHLDVIKYLLRLVVEVQWLLSSPPCSLCLLHDCTVCCIYLGPLWFFHCVLLYFFLPYCRWRS